MNDRTILRALWRDVIVRDDRDGRTVAGIAVPFDRPSPVSDYEGRYLESFQRGAFTQTLSRRSGSIKLIRDHERGHLPLGRVSLAEERQDGLFIEARITEGSDDADYVLSLVRDGALDGFSVGGVKVMSRWADLGNISGARTIPIEGGEVVRTEIRLDEISLTAWPAHDDARVLAVRNQIDPLDASSTEAGAEVVTTGTEAASRPSGWSPARRMALRRINHHDLSKESRG